jgi:hypothetical protein
MVRRVGISCGIADTFAAVNCDDVGGGGLRLSGSL